MQRTLASRSGAARLVRVGVAVAMIASMLAVAGSSIALGQETAECEVTDLGTLGSFFDRVLEAEGRWTTEDCDSRFRAGSDAHTYRFEVADASRVRIGLSSAEADAYLYLLAEDGSRIADNDDNGARLDARVERDLAPGIYLVEATTVGGRDRGPADFTLTVSRLEGCDSVHLGTLEPGVDLTAEGSWSLETCGSRFVSAHPAHAYSFNLAEAARVRIDLESDTGDPVLSLASLEHGIIGANDDGGGGRDARIEQYLNAGVYLIEATTYLERDNQPLQADFTLTVHIVDEAAQQQEPRLKVEEVRAPAEVVAGDPFTVHYRIGNLGGGEAARRRQPRPHLSRRAHGCSICSAPSRGYGMPASPTTPTTKPPARRAPPSTELPPSRSRSASMARNGCSSGWSPRARRTRLPDRTPMPTARRSDSTGSGTT